MAPLFCPLLSGSCCTLEEHSTGDVVSKAPFVGLKNFARVKRQNVVMEIRRAVQNAGTTLRTRYSASHGSACSRHPAQTLICHFNLFRLNSRRSRRPKCRPDASASPVSSAPKLRSHPRWHKVRSLPVDHIERIRLETDPITNSGRRRDVHSGGRTMNLLVSCRRFCR